MLRRGREVLLRVDVWKTGSVRLVPVRGPEVEVGDVVLARAGRRVLLSRVTNWRSRGGGEELELDSGDWIRLENIFGKVKRGG